MRIQELDPPHVKTLIEMTERLIEQTGFEVSSTEILERAEQAGAQVDRDKQLIRIPTPLLRRLLSQIPKTYTVAGGNRQTWEIGGGTQYVSAIVIDPWIIDSKTRGPRRPCLNDLIINTILTQQHDSVACVSRMDFPVTDDPGPYSSQRALLTHLLLHSKHNMAYVSNDDDLELWLKIGSILAQGEPLFGSGLLSFAVAVRSPLTLTDLNCRILLATTGLRLPVIPTICPMAGMTGPYDVASTLLLANTETIFLAALTQLLQPGNPFLYAIGPSVANMQTGEDQYYTIDKVLWKVAAVELARAYGIPAMAECGGTMGWRTDLQSGAESMLFMQAAVASGADLLTGIGSCFNANGLASEMIVIQHAWLEAARRIRTGISMDHLEEGLADIEEVGVGGHFLISDLTLDQLYREAFFTHPLFDYNGKFVPDDEGPMWERASRRIDELTREYSSPLPVPVQNSLISLFRDRFGFESDELVPLQSPVI
ncbi:MAG: hypothetical protein GX900_02685 [Clostridiaceae bacterium]|nr:hypothetical protein [Clostridiaceae bacterium]